MYPNLKLFLWKSGIRQNRLAKGIGIDEALLSKILNGFRTPGPEIKQQIAAFLKCDEEWLFQTSEDLEPRKTSGGNPAGPFS